MEKLVKIAEINGESVKSAHEVARALENAGFVTIPCESYEENIIVVKRVESKENDSFMGVGHGYNN